ncbi:MAG: PDZ domain-containing protein, partial [Thermoanaerobaculia bacterium]|nr:PDZ domain-containing protein [Thermoanaerobaculia bacterium]
VVVVHDGGVPIVELRDLDLHGLDLDLGDLDCTEEGDHRVCVAHKVIESHGGEPVRRGYLGVELTRLTPELRRHFGVPEDQGVMVSRVAEDSPAAAAGLEVGDVVTAVDGEAIAHPRDLVHAIRPHREGDLATVEVYREGLLEQITVSLAEREGRHLRLHLGDHTAPR